VCQAKSQQLFSFKAHYHGLDLSLKISREAIPERWFVMVILAMPFYVVCHGLTWEVIMWKITDFRNIFMV
jgi:hypothetical protein